jgi:hypothetical protein
MTRQQINALILLAWIIAATAIMYTRHDWRGTPSPNTFQRIDRLTGEVVQIKSAWLQTGETP